MISLSNKKLIERIEKSLNLICEAEREKDAQDILSNILKCDVRKVLNSSTYPDVEVDLLGNDYAIEIKYNDKYYSGISQLLVQKYLYGFDNLYLLHIHNFLTKQFRNGFEKLAQDIGFIGILIDKKNKECIVIK